MGVNRIVFSVAAVAATLLYLSFNDSDPQEDASPAISETIAKVEPTTNNEMAQPPAVNQQLIDKKQSDNETTEIVMNQINFFSIEEVFEATKHQALALLKEYKLHQSNDSAESQFRLYEIRVGCMETRIETQEDLDGWATNYESSLHNMDDRLASMMIRIGYCREVVAYLGYEGIRDIDLTVTALTNASQKNHPIAKLITHKNDRSFSLAAVQKLFRNAYDHLKNPPLTLKKGFYTHLRKADFYQLVRGYINKGSFEHKASERNVEYMALTIMMLREQLLMENQYKDDASTILLEEFQKVLLPSELDEIFTREAELAKAMENGDWSWLQYIDSET